jgi:hypothetical protein
MIMVVPFDRTHGRLRIVSAGPLDQYQVFVDGVELDGAFGSDVLNSLARGEWAKYGVVQIRFNEQAGRLPPRLTVDGFFFLMREFGPVPECVPLPIRPQSRPSAGA